MTQRLYLDNAATSFPKPEEVYRAVERYQRELGAAVGRGSSRTGLAVQRQVDRCRQMAAELLDVEGEVIFTFNGTDSLNLAIHGLLQPGDRVVTTCWEHNSVLRPLRTLQDTHGIETTYVPSDAAGGIDLSAMQQAIATGPQLVVLTHASNVTGVLQPIAEVAAMARDRGICVLLDAAQTAGHVPISMRNLGIDMLACPGHKGLLGPLGTGLLAIRKGLELRPTRQGGTGTSSESAAQPVNLPERFESGNHNAPGLFGLAAALEWIHREGVEKIEEREVDLMRKLISGIRSLPNLTVHYPDAERVGVVSLSSPFVEPQVLSSLLEQHFGIETRAGLHCAPMAHEELGTLAHGGTVRFSVGPFNTADEIDTTLESLAQIAVALPAMGAQA